MMYEKINNKYFNFSAHFYDDINLPPFLHNGNFVFIIDCHIE